MKTVEKEKRGIKFVIKIQFIGIAIIVTVGGIVYSINTGEWFNAFGTAIALFAITSLWAHLTYIAALSQHEKTFPTNTNHQQASIETEVQV